jgi:predicted aconitase with swiveling domain
METDNLVGKHILGFNYIDLKHLSYLRVMDEFVGKKGKIIKVDFSRRIVEIKFDSYASFWYPVDHPDFKIVDEDTPVQGEKLLFSIV